MPQSTHQQPSPDVHPPALSKWGEGRSLLACPAWLRMLLVLPGLLALWLAVWWANGAATPW